MIIIYFPRAAGPRTTTIILVSCYGLHVSTSKELASISDDGVTATTVVFPFRRVPLCHTSGGKHDRDSAFPKEDFPSLFECIGVLTVTSLSMDWQQASHVTLTVFSWNILSLFMDPEDTLLLSDCYKQ